MIKDKKIARKELKLELAKSIVDCIRKSYTIVDEKTIKAIAKGATQLSKKIIKLEKPVSNKIAPIKPLAKPLVKKVPQAKKVS